MGHRLLGHKQGELKLKDFMTQHIRRKSESNRQDSQRDEKAEPSITNKHTLQGCEHSIHPNYNKEEGSNSSSNHRHRRHGRRMRGRTPPAFHPMRGAAPSNAQSIGRLQMMMQRRGVATARPEDRRGRRGHRPHRVEENRGHAVVARHRREVARVQGVTSGTNAPAEPAGGGTDLDPIMTIRSFQKDTCRRGPRGHEAVARVSSFSLVSASVVSSSASDGGNNNVASGLPCPQPLHLDQLGGVAFDRPAFGTMVRSKRRHASVANEMLSCSPRRCAFTQGRSNPTGSQRTRRCGRRWRPTDVDNGMRSSMTETVENGSSGE